MAGQRLDLCKPRRFGSFLIWSSAVATFATGTPDPGRWKMIDQSIDYDGLMQANLARVFGERDASRRDESYRRALCRQCDTV